MLNAQTYMAFYKKRAPALPAPPARSFASVVASRPAAAAGASAAAPNRPPPVPAQPLSQPQQAQPPSRESQRDAKRKRQAEREAESRAAVAAAQAGGDARVSSCGGGGEGSASDEEQPLKASAAKRKKGRQLKGKAAASTAVGKGGAAAAAAKAVAMSPALPTLPKKASSLDSATCLSGVASVHLQLRRLIVVLCMQGGCPGSSAQLCRHLPLATASFMLTTIPLHALPAFFLHRRPPLPLPPQPLRLKAVAWPPPLQGQVRIPLHCVQGLHLVLLQETLRQVARYPRPPCSPQCSHRRCQRSRPVALHSHRRLAGGLLQCNAKPEQRGNLDLFGGAALPGCWRMLATSCGNARNQPGAAMQAGVHATDGACASSVPVLQDTAAAAAAATTAATAKAHSPRSTPAAPASTTAAATAAAAGARIVQPCLLVSTQLRAFLPLLTLMHCDGQLSFCGCLKIYL